MDSQTWRYISKNLNDSDCLIEFHLQAASAVTQNLIGLIFDIEFKATEPY